MDNEAKEQDLPGYDENFTLILNLKIAPHPDAKQPKAMDVNYNINSGVLKIKTRTPVID